MKKRKMRNFSKTRMKAKVTKRLPSNPTRTTRTKNLRKLPVKLHQQRNSTILIRLNCKVYLTTALQLKNWIKVFVRTIIAMIHLRSTRIIWSIIVVTLNKQTIKWKSQSVNMIKMPSRNRALNKRPASNVNSKTSLWIHLTIWLCCRQTWTKPTNQNWTCFLMSWNSIRLHFLLLY